MQLSSLILAATAVSAQLIWPDLPLKPHNRHHPISRSLRSGNNSLIPPFKAGQHTLKEQDDSICATNGEKQWTGTVDVTDERRLFFWFFDSRSDPEHDPVIIWINGGPGASSMTGLFTEIGPCYLEPNASKTTVNEWAWNRNASLLVIDQPAGEGFSPVANDDALPSSDEDGAVDFQTFLRVFFNDVFPKRAKLPIHFAAESYGGHYLPTYVRHIQESRQNNSKTAFQGNLTSGILVSGLLDRSATFLGLYELLCVDENGRGLLNATACNSMRRAYPDCFKLQRQCEADGGSQACFDAFDYCGDNLTGPFLDSGRDFYDIKHVCTDEECSNPKAGNFSEYLNKPDVLSALGHPSGREYASISLPMNTAYYESGSFLRSTKDDVGAILDAGQKLDINEFRLLVVHGNDDASVNVAGTLLSYDAAPWSQQADFPLLKWHALPDEINATGMWKGTEDGKLVFVRVDDAGHMVPTSQREGSLQIVEKWIFGDQWKGSPLGARN